MVSKFLHVSTYILILCLLISCSHESELPPKDQKLIENYRKNKHVFEKFVKIFLEKKGLNHMQAPPEGLTVQAPLTINIDDLGKLNQQELISDMQNKLQASVIAVNSHKYESMRYKKNADLGPINEISFYSFRSGIVSSGGKGKGISYFVYEQPRFLEESLDKFDPPQNKPFPVTDKPSIRVYSKIEDGWYLFSEEWK